MYADDLGDETAPWAGQDAVPAPEPSAPADNAPVDTMSPEGERNALWNAIVALGSQAEKITESQRLFGSALEALTERILSTPAPTLPAGSAAAVPAVSLPRGAPRFKEPFVFSGLSTEVEPWIDEVQNAIHLQRNTLIDDYDKAVYLAGYLKQGSPKSWYYGVRNSQPHLLHRFDDLLADFRTHFGDSDLANNALRKIKSLKQTGPCSVYASKSRELHEHLQLNDFMKINYFYDGLKDGVKDLLVGVPNKSPVFDTYVLQCIELDNRLHNRELERKSNSKGSSSHSHRPERHDNQARAAQPASTSAASTSQVVPMEIDAVKRGPVSAEEKARRKREGLCFYCGQGKHRIDECPNMSAKAKAAYAAKPRNAAPSGKA